MLSCLSESAVLNDASACANFARSLRLIVTARFIATFTFIITERGRKEGGQGERGREGEEGERARRERKGGGRVKERQVEGKIILTEKREGRRVYTHTHIYIHVHV